MDARTTDQWVQAIIASTIKSPNQPLVAEYRSRGKTPLRPRGRVELETRSKPLQMETMRKITPLVDDILTEYEEERKFPDFGYLAQHL